MKVLANLLYFVNLYTYCVLLLPYKVMYYYTENLQLCMHKRHNVPLQVPIQAFSFLVITAFSLVSCEVQVWLVHP